MMKEYPLPYSSNSGKTYCDRAITRIVNQMSNAIFDSFRILDLGVGVGTYSDRYTRSLLPRDKFYWTGIEIWAPYIKQFNLESKYDEIINQDAQSYLEQSGKHDICFMGDIVEHMTIEQALTMVNLALDRCNVVIISIPIGYYPQPEFEGNPYERHVKDNWTHNEMMSYWHKDIVEYGAEKFQDGIDIGVYVLSRHKKNFIAEILKPQIAVYGICKNEEAFIGRFYDSIKDADFISIVDTGSTDSTFDQLINFVRLRTEQYGHEEEFKIEKIGQSIRNVSDGSMQAHRSYINPWRFDDARNVALSLLPEDPDVCISIDIDELLEPGWKETLSTAILNDLHTLGRPADRYYHRFSTIWNWQYPDQPPNFTDHWHERIHSRKGYRWKLPVHEMLVKDGPEEIRWLNDFKIIQKPDSSKSRSNYLTLLEQSLKEDPNRWKSWSFYAGDLQGVGRFQDAIDAINKAKLIPDSDQAYLCFQASSNYSQLGDSQKAISEMLQAVASSNTREYRVRLAQLYHNLNKPREALNAILMASEITERSFGYSYDPQCWGQSFDDLVKQITVECKL